MDNISQLKQMPVQSGVVMGENPLLSQPAGAAETPATLLPEPSVKISTPLDAEKLMAQVRAETDETRHHVTGRQFASTLAQIVATNDNISDHQKKALADLAAATEALAEAKRLVDDNSVLIDALTQQTADLVEAMKTTKEERQKRLEEKERLEERKRAAEEAAAAKAEEVAEGEAADEAVEGEVTEKVEAEEEAEGESVEDLDKQIAEVEKEIQALDRTIGQQEATLQGLENQAKQAQISLAAATKAMGEALIAIGAAQSQLDATGLQALAEAIRATVRQIETATPQPDAPTAEEEITALAKVAEEFTANIEERNDKDLVDLIAKIDDAARAREVVPARDLPDHEIHA